jgi:hypothetical protein
LVNASCASFAPISPAERTWCCAEEQLRRPRDRYGARHPSVLGRPMMEFSEGDFEEAARSAHTRYGIAPPTSLNEMLEKRGL